MHHYLYLSLQTSNQFPLYYTVAGDFQSGIITAFLGMYCNDVWNACSLLQQQVTHRSISTGHWSNTFLKTDICSTPIWLSLLAGYCLKIKTPSYQYRNSHYKDKTVSQLSYLYNKRSIYLERCSLRYGPELFLYLLSSITIWNVFKYLWFPVSNDSILSLFQLQQSMHRFKLPFLNFLYFVSCHSFHVLQEAFS